MDSKASKKTSTAPPTMGNKKAKKSSSTVSAKEPQMYAVKDAFHKTAYTKKLNSHVDLPLIERAKLEGGAAQTLRDAERRNPKKTIGNREGFFDAAIPSAAEADKKKKGDKKRLVGFGIREAAAEDEENAFAAETHYRNGKRRGVESIMHTSGGGRAGRGRGRGCGRGRGGGRGRGRR